MSCKKALVALPFLGPLGEWVNTRFVDALEGEVRRRGEKWVFVSLGPGDLPGGVVEAIRDVHFVVILSGVEDGLAGLLLGYSQAMAVPVVGVDLEGGSRGGLSLLRDLGLPLAVLKGTEEEAWRDLAAEVLDEAFPGEGERGDYPGLLRHGLAIRPPHGYPEICRVFGDIESYVGEDGTLDPSWEKEMLGYASLPFSLPLSWAPEKVVTRIHCHRLLAPVLEGLFQEVVDRGLRPLVRTYGGCFSFRRMRGGGRLSTHSWGIAIDLNPDTNPLGSKGDMAPELVSLFREFGFVWGGAFSRPDPMHFQFCSGY